MKNNDHFAIVVGIDHYQSYKPLNGARNDANDFVDWLRSEAGGNLPEANPDNPEDDNIKVILSESGFDTPTALLIDDAVEYIIKLSDDFNRQVGKRLYLFMAGHGCSAPSSGNQSGSGEVLLSMPRDNYLRTHKYPGVRCADYFRECGLFQEVVLFMDCCRDNNNTQVSTHWAFTVKPDEALVGDTAYWHGFAVGAGKRAREREVEKGTWRGNFSRQILQGLKGAASDAHGVVTSESLRTYVKRVFNEDGTQRPEIHSYGDIEFCHPPASAITRVRLTIERRIPNSTIWLFEGGNPGTLIVPQLDDGAFVYFQVAIGSLYLAGAAPATFSETHASHLSTTAVIHVKDSDLYETI